MKKSLLHLLADPDRFRIKVHAEKDTQSSYMNSVVNAWEKDFICSVNSETESKNPIFEELRFIYEERIAIFEHDALMHREAAEHRALKWIEPRLKDAGIDPVFFNNIIEKDYEKRKSINSLPPQSISAA